MRRVGVEDPLGHHVTLTDAQDRAQQLRCVCADAASDSGSIKAHRGLVENDHVDPSALFSGVVLQHLQAVKHKCGLDQFKGGNPLCHQTGAMLLADTFRQCLDFFISKLAEM